jgi:hemerythrin-like domain-containing protein
MSIVEAAHSARVGNAAMADTRLAHKVYRRATTLLAGAATSAHVPYQALRELRDFVVAEVSYHHEAEDNLVWPLLQAADPGAAEALTQLTGEHRALACALDLLGRVVVGPDGDRRALARVARLVQAQVDEHLATEELVIVPFLVAHISDAAWAKLSRAIVASAPTEHCHLLVGLLDQVGTPDEVVRVFAELPGPARALLPNWRMAGQRTLAAIEATPRKPTLTGACGPREKHT